MIRLADLKWLPPLVMITAILGGLSGAIATVVLLPSHEIPGPLISILLVSGLLYAGGVVLRVTVNEDRRRKHRKELREAVGGREETEEIELYDDSGERTCYSYTVTIGMDDEEVAIQEIRICLKNPSPEGAEERREEFDALRFVVRVESERAGRIFYDPAGDSNSLEFVQVPELETGEVPPASDPEQNLRESVRGNLEQMFEETGWSRDPEGRPFFQADRDCVQFVVPYEKEYYEPERVRSITDALLGIKRELSRTN